MVRRTSIAVLLLLVSLTGLLSCGKQKEKKLNSRVTLWRKDKIPYGTFYAYEELPRLFPDAEIVIEKELADKKNLFGLEKNPVNDKVIAHYGKVTNIIISPSILMVEDEVQHLLQFVYNGNKVFLSAFEISPILMDSLKLTTRYLSGANNMHDSLSVGIIHPLTGDTSRYSYPGEGYDNYFSKMDSGYTTVLGWNNKGQPNFVKISYESGGVIYLHLAPMAFTNFFLLHKENKAYYDQVFSYLPEKTELITWNEYYRNHRPKDGNGENNTSRIFSWMKTQPPLAAGLLLLGLLFLLLLLFESKRKQRPIPVRVPLKNTSLDFVKTIGRLYFQRKDNRNLALKMTAHFQDYVRTRFSIPTSRMDEDFKKKLAYKTGIDAEVIDDIVYQARYLSDQATVTDNELMTFNKQLENFYKKV